MEVGVDGAMVGAAGMAGEATYSDTQPTDGEVTDTEASEVGMDSVGDLELGMEAGDLGGEAMVGAMVVTMEGITVETRMTMTMQ